jgi:hypothetical protein
MADVRNEQQRRDLLREIEEIQSRIVEQNRAAATATGQELRALENRIASERLRLQLQEDQLRVVEDILTEQERIRQVEIDRNARQSEANDLQDDFSNSFARMSRTQQEFLTNSNNGNTAFASITARILDLRQQEVDASDEDRDILVQRRAILEGIRTEQVEAAEAAAMARQELFGINDAEIRRMEFQQSIVGLSQDEADIAKEAFEAKENLLQQQERYNQLQNTGSEILGKLPGGLQSVIGGIRGMIVGIRAFGVSAAIATAGITLVVGAIVAGLDYFMQMEQASEDFRKNTGITNSMMGDMALKANNVGRQFTQYGVSIEDAYDAMASLRNEISEVGSYSEAAVAGIALMKTNFGVSAEEAAKVQGVLESVGGLSQDTAVSVQMQVANMAKLAGIAPKKVLQDIAENAEAASKFFKGDITALTKNAIQARRMGSSLKEQVSLAEKLLDFEGSIEEELVAATFVSGQFNLSRARALAFEGKTAEAAEETLKQIQRSGDFRKKDYFTQQQLAKASGMTVEEINKQLNVQDKLSNLTTEEREKAEKAIEQGLDITNINDEQLMQEVQKAAAQKEMASTISDMENTFKGILATVGGALMPVFKILAETIKPTLFVIKLIAKTLEFIIDSIIWVIKKIPFIGGIVEKIGSIAGEIDSSVSNFSLSQLTKDSGMSSVTNIGDVISPADGKTRISTKEGGLFELSPNDDLIAAPGIASAMNRGGTSTEGGNIELNLSQLSAPLNAVVNEIKALRADMANGKIAVYMDTEKVTSKIGRQVDISTRNNFNLGQA